MRWTSLRCSHTNWWIRGTRGVVGSGGKAAVVGLVTRGRTFDAAVIDVGPGNIRDFGLKEEGDVLMEDRASVRPALW